MSSCVDKERKVSFIKTAIKKFPKNIVIRSNTVTTNTFGFDGC